MLVLIALGVQGAVVVLAATGAPFELRLPVGLVYVFSVPGFAVVGLLRTSDPTSEAALSLVSSIAICTAVAQMLAWFGSYSLAATLALLTLLTTAGLLLQLRAELAGSARPTGNARLTLSGNGQGPDRNEPNDRTDRLWPRRYWS